MSEPVNQQAVGMPISLRDAARSPILWSRRCAQRSYPSWRYELAKHSKAERERRAQQNEDVERIEAAWMASMPAATAKEFAAGVEAARARGPQERPPDMAPGTPPRPPRPGREPKPKEDQTRRRRF